MNARGFSARYTGYLNACVFLFQNNPSLQSINTRTAESGQSLSVPKVVSETFDKFSSCYMTMKSLDKESRRGNRDCIDIRELVLIGWCKVIKAVCHGVNISFPSQ